MTFELIANGFLGISCAMEEEWSKKSEASDQGSPGRSTGSKQPGVAGTQSPWFYMKSGEKQKLVVYVKWIEWGCIWRWVGNYSCH